MQLYCGTSGFSYKEWRGSFYPDELPEDDMLAYYATKLRSVEINNTFYRMPKSAVVQHWAEQVSGDFRFVIKASRRITHQGRLKNTKDTVEYLWRAVDHLGEHKGPILLQLPPNQRKDLDRLRTFLGEWTSDDRAVFEFRHETWVDEEVRDTLKSANAAWCVADTDGDPAEPCATADFGYFRLRRDHYTDDELRDWADRMRAQPWQEVYVFFKHEDGGVSPDAALRFVEVWENS